MHRRAVINRHHLGMIPPTCPPSAPVEDVAKLLAKEQGLVVVPEQKPFVLQDVAESKGGVQRWFVEHTGEAEGIVER